jgi:DNA helicase IV
MKHIHVLELDVICLTLLKAARELTTEGTIKSRLNDAKFEKLKAITEQYKNQILVDEATDFSPIQLACMFAITQPSIQSFFACGDFNQRLTYWGTRSAKDIQWVCPNIKIEKIAVSYRQSAELNTFAFKLIELNGEAATQTELPQYAHAQKIKPVLIECVPSNSHELIEWIAMRIREIEQFVQQLPSIAILVNGEALVTTIAQSLDEELEDDNIKVMACSNGQVIGQDQHVRVFNVEHIKGLEFEAVFFVGIDELARQHPDLFDKYLYVGATRAATYLGFSCDSYLPEKVDSLRSLFGSDWSFSESIK